MNIPFTRSQATDIAEDFSDLEGTGLIIESESDTITCIIQNVAVVPYPLAEREQFICNYQTNGDVTAALEGYSGHEYEVLIIAVKNEIYTMPIRAYTARYGVRYRYPEL